MNFNDVISFMNQQSRVLTKLEDLLAHNEKQDKPGHSVKPEDIETLKAYVENMKTAVNTAKALAKYYEKAGNTKPETKQAEANDTEKEKTNKPKKKRGPSKKETVKENAPRESLKKEEPEKEKLPGKKPEENVLEEFDFLN